MNDLLKLAIEGHGGARSPSAADARSAAAVPGGA